MIRLAARSRLRFRQAWLRWRHTWWFQFAHGPLCERFKTNAFRVGRLRLCRSCTLLYAALALTLCMLAWLGPSSMWVVPVCYAALIPLAVLSHPRIYRRFSRITKDGLRFGCGIVLGLLFGLLVTAWWQLAACTLALLFGLLRLFSLSRRAVKARECDGCPELGGNCVCSGYAQQSESIRAFRDQIDDELNQPAAAAYVLPMLARKPLEPRSRS